MKKEYESFFAQMEQAIDELMVEPPPGRMFLMVAPERREGDDQSFFADNPRRKFHLRRSRPDDYPPGLGNFALDHTLVRQVRPGLRTKVRRTLIATEEEIARLAADDKALRRLWTAHGSNAILTHGDLFGDSLSAVPAATKRRKRK